MDMTLFPPRDPSSKEGEADAKYARVLAGKFAASWMKIIKAEKSDATRNFLLDYIAKLGSNVVEQETSKRGVPCYRRKFVSTPYVMYVVRCLHVKFKSLCTQRNLNRSGNPDFFYSDLRSCILEDMPLRNALRDGFRLYACSGNSAEYEKFAHLLDRFFDFVINLFVKCTYDEWSSKVLTPNSMSAIRQSKVFG